MNIKKFSEVLFYLSRESGSILSLQFSMVSNNDYYHVLIGIPRGVENPSVIEDIIDEHFYKENGYQINVIEEDNCIPFLYNLKLIHFGKQMSHVVYYKKVGRDA